MTILDDSLIETTETRQAAPIARGYAVVYDRSARVYQVTDAAGNVVQTFPSKDKGAAVRFAICMADPALGARAARMAQRNPLLERVAWAGAELAANNAVEIMTPVQVSETGVAAMVDSSDGMGRYAIATEPVPGHALLCVMTCNCAYHSSGAAPVSASGYGRVCKHIAAYWFTRNTQEALQ